MLEMQVHSILADIISEQLNHVGNPLRNDGWLIPALPARLDQTLQEHTHTHTLTDLLNMHLLIWNNMVLNQTWLKEKEKRLLGLPL